MKRIMVWTVIVLINGCATKSDIEINKRDELAAKLIISAMQAGQVQDYQLLRKGENPYIQIYYDIAENILAEAERRSIKDNEEWKPDIVTEDFMRKVAPYITPEISDMGDKNKDYLFQGIPNKAQAVKQ